MAIIFQRSRLTPISCRDGARVSLVLLSVLVVGVGLASPGWAKQDKVQICHRPPGNPTNFKMKSVGAPAVLAHMAHGDNVVGEEVCDGIDNDCDGFVDEDASGNPLTQATTCGVGECAGNTGMKTCTNGSFGGDTCDPFAGASAELCDGMDNDCDGTPDGPLADSDCTDGIDCTVDACVAGSCRNSASDDLCQSGTMCDLSLGSCVPDLDDSVCPCVGTQVDGVTWNQTFATNDCTDLLGILNFASQEITCQEGMDNHELRLILVEEGWVCDVVQFNDNVCGTTNQTIASAVLSQPQLEACRESLRQIAGADDQACSF